MIKAYKNKTGSKQNKALPIFILFDIIENKGYNNGE